MPIPENFPKKGEIKMDLFFKRMQSPIGEISIFAVEKAVVGLLMGQHDKKGLRRKYNLAREKDNDLLVKTREELQAFFAGRLKKFTVPVEFTGTDFQKAVWKSLQSIEFGQLATYADIARQIGRPAAVRAVGGAIGSNPVSIIIPCHRVIGSDNSLTGFGGGLPAKQLLLEIEGHTIRNLKLDRT
jgi:methylated-DNA-[protein]-cysteine S-methyltransferase